MENPFELILEKLNKIEVLLNQEGKLEPKEKTVFAKDILKTNEAAKYLSMSKSSLYKRTCNFTIPHFKVGGAIFFKRSELDEWIFTHRVKTRENIEREALDYVSKRRVYKKSVR